MPTKLEEIYQRGLLRYRKISKEKSHQWKLGWFRLDEEGIIQYYVDEQERLQIPYTKMTSINPSFDSSFLGFLISTEENVDVDYQFAFSNESETLWVSSLEWIRNFTLSQGGRRLFQKAHVSICMGFVRMASSGSESESSESHDDHPPSHFSSTHQENLQNETLSSLGLQDRIRLISVNIDIDTNHHPSKCIPIVLEETYLSKITITELKFKIFEQLKINLNELEKTNSNIGDPVFMNFKKTSCQNPDMYVLKIVTPFQYIWLRDESLSAKYYLDKRKSFSFVPSSTSQITFCIVLGRNLPPEPLQCKIVATETETSCLTDRTYTMYTIRITHGLLSWSVNRRYNDFHNLHCSIKNALENNRNPKCNYFGFPVEDYLPRLPPKHLVTFTSGVFVEKRRVQLETYLEDLVSLPETTENIDVMSFLGVLSTSRYKESHDNGRSVIHITELLKLAKPGDVILFKCRFHASKVQRVFTGAQYDHVGCVVPNANHQGLSILEATSDGVLCYPLISRLRAYHQEASKTIVIRCFSVSRILPNINEKIQSFVQRVEGKPYSLSGLWKSSTGRTGNDCFDKFFCSELIASCLKEAGLLSNKRPSNYYWPGAFAEGGDVEKDTQINCRLGPELVIDCRLMEIGQAIVRSR